MSCIGAVHPVLHSAVNLTSMGVCLLAGWLAGWLDCLLSTHTLHTPYTPPPPTPPDPIPDEIKAAEGLAGGEEEGDEEGGVDMDMVWVPGTPEQPLAVPVEYEYVEAEVSEVGAGCVGGGWGGWEFGGVDYVVAEVSEVGAGCGGEVEYEWVAAEASEVG